MSNTEELRALNSTKFLTDFPPVWINCPYCKQPIDWKSSQVCGNGHNVESIDGVPMCFTSEAQARKITADPGYPLPYAIDVARELGKSESFTDSINRFYDRRAIELGRNVDYERNIVLSRRVGTVANSISDACVFLDKLGRPFPSRDRIHIEIGCGMSFGLAASSVSYFGENIIGIDLSPHYLVMSRLQLAEKGVNSPKLVCADICDGWPIPLDHYDVGFISFEGVLEHIKSLDAFFGNIRRIKSYPYVLYLTVPYSFTFLPETHFNLRGITWLPRAIQDRYIAWRLGVNKIDHVEFYSHSSLRRTLSRYFKPSTIVCATNSPNPLKAHYLRCIVYVEGPHSLS